MTPPTSSSAIPLAVDGAVKRFGQVAALAGASFDLRQGELLGLLGPNGAGKTTMIKAIAGRATLNGGTIRLFGRALGAQDPRPELGVVPQELAVYDKLTATENLEVFGRLNGVARGALAERVRWALDWSDLADRAGEPVRRFSGGMKRRLNIACSLVHEPKVVLLDEPTAGVDPQSRERIYEMLGALQKTGVSIVLTTHHLEEAEQRCERIVILDHGVVVAAGTLGELTGDAGGSARSVTISFGAPPSETQLAEALGRLRQAGCDISDVRVARQSLQDVFIALTGRELRE